MDKIKLERIGDQIIAKIGLHSLVRGTGADRWEKVAFRIFRHQIVGMN